MVVDSGLLVGEIPNKEGMIHLRDLFNFLTKRSALFKELSFMFKDFQDVAAAVLLTS